MTATSTLYISDMDGTLLDNNSQVSPTSRAIISELSHRGALITVATARTPATVVPLLEGTYTRVPAIVMTGAALWDRERREMFNTKLLENALEIAGIFGRYNINPFVYTVTSPGHLDVFHPREMTRPEEEFYRLRRDLTLKKFHIGVKPSSQDFDRTILLFGYGPTESMAPLATELQSQGECSVSYYPDILNKERSLIEVFAPGVSKALAVKELSEHIGADRVVVFGDNLNDLSMMAVADLSVAVDNAFPEVKAAAGLVIGPNSADSVARFIEANYRP